jgi:hypothetical protein
MSNYLAGVVAADAGGDTATTGRRIQTQDDSSSSLASRRCHMPRILTRL